MPHRNVDLMVGLGGVLILAWILVRGRDVGIEAKNGGRRYRRALRAGLALLALLGIPWPVTMAEEVTSVTRTLREDNRLEAFPEGKHLQEIWKEAEEILSGKRGMYPFDEAGKKKILGELQTALNDIDGLTEKGAWFPAEGQLLKTELSAAISGVQGKRPSEMKMATCYKPMMFRPAPLAIGRLDTRLPLLEKLAGGPLSLLVQEKVLKSVYQDVALLEKLVTEKRLETSQIETAQDIIRKAHRILDRIGSPPVVLPPASDEK